MGQPATVHQLPTAAAKPVRQCRPWSPTTRPTRRQLQAEGRLVTFPTQSYRSPAWRAIEAEREARLERFRDAGITRTAPLMLLSAVLLVLPDDQQAELLEKLRLLNRCEADPAMAAALEYAEGFLGSARTEGEA